MVVEAALSTLCFYMITRIIHQKLLFLSKYTHCLFRYNFVLLQWDKLSIYSHIFFSSAVATEEALVLGGVTIERFIHI
jgi:hypothetical protein